MALQHIHKRKRIKSKLQPYPHPNKWMQQLDKTLLIVAIIAPISVIPQIFEIVGTQNAEGISLITWILLASASLPWIIYGIAHRAVPILVAHSMWITVDLAVIGTTLWYT
jgi:uncharacterized protein with PQ loop repeat